MNTLDELLYDLKYTYKGVNLGLGRTVADMLESIASNDDAEMQTPGHLISSLDELMVYARYAQRVLRGFPQEAPVPRKQP